MFDNTITMTIDGSARILTRVNQDKFASSYRYRSPDLGLDLNIRHQDRLVPGQTVRTDRHNVELVATTYPVGLSPVTRKAYIVIENLNNADPTAVDDLPVALAAGFMTVAQVARLVNWES